MFLALSRIRFTSPLTSPRITFPRIFGLGLALLLGNLFSLGSIRGEEEDEPQQAARMLMVTQSAGFKHGSVTRPGGRLAPAEQAMTELGVATGLFRVDCIQDVSNVTKEMLDSYQLILFYTTGDLPFQDDVRDYLFTEWVKKKGNGFLGAHSAADTYHNYEPYWEMLGGTFDGHPWNAGDTVTIEVHDQEHPASRPWGERLVIRDEIYQFKNWQPEKVRVLASLDFEHTPLRKPYHVPILWVKEYGEGKVMHMSLGHNEHVWETPEFLEAMAGGIRWMLGLEEADATPNPEVSQAADQRAKEMYERFKDQ
jgi:uncharacterized protein